MADNKKFYWIKLKADRFQVGGDLDFIMSQKNGAEYVVLYLMLCTQTINTGGQLISKLGEVIIPFDIDSITRNCKYFSRDTVMIALGLYKKLGLIYEQENGILKIAEYEHIVGSYSMDEHTRQLNAERQQRFRERNKLKSNIVTNSVTVTDTVTLCNALNRNAENKRLEIRDKSIDINNIDTNVSVEKTENEPLSHQSIIDEFNSICKSFPRCTKLTEKRRKAINAVVSMFSIDEIKTAFEKAENSDFLSGRSGKWSGASFDWLMVKGNMLKVLEGNYENKDESSSAPRINSTSDIDWIKEGFENANTKIPF